MKSLLTRLTLASAGATVVVALIPSVAQAAVSVLINIAPPLLPIYAQPAMPGDGYMWTPGYWSWSPDDGDYYWVPGTWILTPFIGALWTPGYWGWYGGGYRWNRGYWGTQIGYYGGINYGYGYAGSGYQGGYWRNGAFSYNRTVNNIGRAHVTNVYNTTVRSVPITRVSYNGGKGGMRIQPTRTEQRVAKMKHQGLTAPQVQHEKEAHSNPALRASTNHGMPKIAATPAPSAFNAPNVVAARGAKDQHSDRPHGGKTQRTQDAPQQHDGARQQSREQAMPPPQREAARQQSREQTAPPPQREAARQQSREQAASPPQREAARQQSREQAAPPPQREAARQQSREQAAPPQQREATRQQSREQAAAPQQQNGSRPHRNEQNAPAQQQAERPAPQQQARAQHQQERPAQKHEDGRGRGQANEEDRREK